MKEPSRSDLAIIIMAGGSGTRFWPASRENTPKQFLHICGPKSMLEMTYLRITPLSVPQKVFVVINESHRVLAAKILDRSGMQILGEPYSRNTVPCIGLGCIHILKEFGNIPTIALPADHFIIHEEEFRRCVRCGISILDQADFVTFGIPATYPETGYGYIERGEAIREGGSGAFKVRRFAEKPDLKTAESFLASGDYFWNAGMFLFRPETMLSEIGTYLPEMRDGLDRIAKVLDTDDYFPTLERAYREMKSVSIDYGVMEKTKKTIYVIPGNFGWSDVGSWTSLRKLRQADQDKDGNLVSGNALLFNTKDCLIHSQSERLVAVLGSTAVLVVDTEDVLLVADLNQCQDLRRIPDALKQKGWTKWL
jgi:mannose-1-phosphate guanylyltransferase